MLVGMMVGGAGVSGKQIIARRRAPIVPHDCLHVPMASAVSPPLSFPLACPADATVNHACDIIVSVRFTFVRACVCLVRASVLRVQHQAGEQTEAR